MDLAPGERLLARHTCPNCDGDLDVCRNSKHYDPGEHNVLYAGQPPSHLDFEVVQIHQGRSKKARKPEPWTDGKRLESI